MLYSATNTVSNQVHVGRRAKAKIEKDPLVGFRIPIEMLRETVEWCKTEKFPYVVPCTQCGGGKGGGSYYHLTFYDTSHAVFFALRWL